MLKFLTKFFDSNETEIKRLSSIVEKINSLESSFEKLNDEEFKLLLERGTTLNDLLPEAFAAVREAAKRSIGQRHFDVQLLGGAVIHQGKIAEMKTGEGKTLVSTLPIYLNSLTGDGVHVVTVNDYLARREPEWMGPIFHFLGLSIGSLNHEKSYLFDPNTQTKEVEKSDIKLNEKEA